MACNCQKGGKVSEYHYTSPKGQKKVYRTEIEAQAAMIRNRSQGANGGSYKVITR